MRSDGACIDITWFGARWYSPGHSIDIIEIHDLSFADIYGIFGRTGRHGKSDDPLQLQ